MRLSQRAMTLQESAIRKLDILLKDHAGVDFYRLNIGQPDIATPSPMLKAIQSYSPHVIAYGPASGTSECRAAFAAYHAQWQQH